MIRNKKTGEIRKLHDGVITLLLKDENQIDDPDFRRYRSVKELCEEWEDVEELPQQYYYIDDCGHICRASANDLEHGARRKNIGNWFNTERQAEEALEKIKEVLNEILHKRPAFRP